MAVILQTVFYLTASIVVICAVPSNCQERQPVLTNYDTNQFSKDVYDPTHTRIAAPELCPNNSQITPCTCYLYPDYGLGIDCSAVISVEQLKQAFQADFTNPAFYELVIRGQSGLPVPIDVLESTTFGPVSFQDVIISYTELHTVHLSVFEKSYDTLKKYVISNSQIYFFAFDELANFAQLNFLDVSSNAIPYLPVITSASLETLDYHGNNLPELSPATFISTPSLRRLMLHQAHITDVPENTFTELTQLEILYLNSNNFTVLRSSAISPSGSSLYVLRLNDNTMDVVEVASIQGLAPSAELQLVNTGLRSMPKEVWEPVFLQLSSPDAIVYLQSNPLVCDCDLWWLIGNDTFMSRMGQLGDEKAACEDGTPLVEVELLCR